MKNRCLNPNAVKYAQYGGRGIKMCDWWFNGDGTRSGFVCFLADMGERPTPAHSIDRYPNNDGDYEPDNCRWATPSEQLWSQPDRQRDARGRFQARIAS